MKNMFARQKPAPGRSSDVKAWVSQRLGLSEDDLVSVAELTCHEPGCPPVETVLTVHRTDGELQTWKIHKSLSEVDETDVDTALTRG